VDSEPQSHGRATSHKALTKASLAHRAKSAAPSVRHKIHIALVDDDPSIHVALQYVFKNLASDWTLDSYSDGREAIASITKSPPSAVLMDIAMPGITGIECTRHLKSSFPQLPVVMFTARDDTENFFSAMMAGASGYVVKPSSPAETVSAVRKVLSGGPALCQRTEQSIVEWLHSLGDNVISWKLTPREQQIMLHVCANRSDKDIALLLQISARTVHNHLLNIYRKLSVNGRDEARKKFIRPFDYF